MSNTLVTSAVLSSLLLGVAPGLVSSAQAVPWPALAQAAQSTTVEGCLAAGTKDGEFAITAGRQRYAVVAAAGVDLSAHLNHKVQLTGTVEGSGDSNVLKASAVKMIATTCDAA
jgi:hypothetical protein